MKKFLLFVCIAGGFAALTACKKDRTCRCTYEGGGFTVSADTVYKDMSKKDAEADCESHNASYTDGGTSYTVTCELQ